MRWRILIMQTTVTVNWFSTEQHTRGWSSSYWMWASSQPRPQPPPPPAFPWHLRSFDFSGDKSSVEWRGPRRAPVLVAMAVWLNSDPNCNDSSLTCLGRGVRLVESARQEGYKQVGGNWLCVSKARCRWLTLHSDAPMYFRFHTHHTHQHAR